MAKQLFFQYYTVPATTHRGNNDAKLNGTAAWWQPALLAEARGNGATNVTVASVLGATPGIEVTSGVATIPVEWLSEPLSADFTIAGTITLNLWAFEATMNDNVAVNAVIEKMDGATGALTQIAKTARITECAVTTAAVNNFTVAPTSTACKRGDRLRVRIFADDAGTMAAGGSMGVSVHGPTAGANGDSWVQFTENLTFEPAGNPPGSTYYLTNTVASFSVDITTDELNASQSRGSSTVTISDTTTNGPVSPLSFLTGTLHERQWFTPLLEAFTLGGKAKFNIRAFESGAGANASLLAEIAVVNGDGTGAVVWGRANIESDASGGELTTADAAEVAWVSGDDIAVAAGQRLRFRILMDDVATGPMVTGFTLSLSYNGPTAGVAGDTYVTLPVAVTEQPTGPQTRFGVVAMPITFGKAVAALKKTFASLALPITFGAATAGRKKVLASLALPVMFGATTAGIRRATGAVAAPFTFTKAVQGQRKTYGTLAAPYIFGSTTAGVRLPKTFFGAVVTPFTFGATTQGIRRTLGQVVAPFTFSKDARGQRKTFATLAAPFIFSKTVAAWKQTFGVVARPTTATFATAGIVTSGAQTHFGVVAAPFIFGKAVQGVRRTTSSVAAPFVFSKAVAGQRKTFSSVVAPFIFGEVTQSRKLYGRTVAPFIFGEVTQGRKQTYGVVARLITWTAATAGINFTGAQTYFGSTTAVFTFGKAVTGQKKTFGTVARSTVFGAATQVQRRTFSSIVVPITFGEVTQARRKTFGVVARPTIVLITTAGNRGAVTYFGIVARPIVFSKAVQGQRRTFSTLSVPVVFGAATQVQRKTFSTVALPIVFSFVVKGFIDTEGVVLNLADAIFIGDEAADAVYAGSELVWTR